MKYKLKICQNEQNIGAIITSPRSREYHDPVLGLGIAHDIIEHPTKSHPDPYIDELMAIGGTIAGRLRNTYTRNWYNIQSEIAGLIYQNPESFTYNTLYPNKATLKNKDIVELINKSVSIAIVNAIPTGNVDAALIESWICEGFSRFNKRFNSYSVYDITNSVFNLIRYEVDKWVKYSEEGDTADLFVDFKKYSVKLIPHG